jgi:2,3-bisphosphoglycerate-independent phosphoglycerate mutase
MDVVEDLRDLDAQATALRENWDRYTFFFVHHKYTDSKGEDGNFEAKVGEIEKVDRFIPRILDLKPDVLLVTGDHSTPAVMRAHSAHPVPFLLHSANLRPDATTEFGERSCSRGAWGVIPGVMLMRLVLAGADKLAKFGA